jgi:hypothetical protein
MSQKIMTISWISAAHSVNEIFGQIISPKMRINVHKAIVDKNQQAKNTRVKNG